MEEGLGGAGSQQAAAAGGGKKGKKRKRTAAVVVPMADIATLEALNQPAVYSSRL